MPAKDIDKIAALLTSDAMEKRVAAAIVLGEINAKGANVKKGLLVMLASGMPPLQRHALDAFSKLGAEPILDQIFPLLTSRDENVRSASARAVASIGQSVVPTLRKRMAKASPREKRAIDSVLAQLGGKEAFSAILGGLPSLSDEATKGVALELRQQIKESDAKTRSAYLTQACKFLALKKFQEAPSAIVAVLRIMGYLEQPNAVPTLLSYATAKKWDSEIRSEALSALRLARGSKLHETKAINALLKIAESEATELARTALYTLGSLELPPSSAARFEKLAAHPDLKRARFAIEQLGRDVSVQTTNALVGIISTLDRVRSEMAANALEGRKGAAGKLAAALAKIDDPERARVVQRAMGPIASQLTKQQRLQLLQRAIDRLAAGKPAWEPLLRVVRDADPKVAASALRDLVTKLSKTKKTDKALVVARVLCRSEQASNDDRFRLAVLELGCGRRDTHPGSRSRDLSLRSLERLAAEGYEVGKALTKDRSLGLEAKYYVGFHFVEEGHPLGEELLADVAKKGARSKIGKMAKNKLALAERDA
ncbi:MAG: HEAT repeat domain-containing protein [Myxococcota bacterium]